MAFRPLSVRRALSSRFIRPRGVKLVACNFSFPPLIGPSTTNGAARTFALRATCADGGGSKALNRLPADPIRVMAHVGFDHVSSMWDMVRSERRRRRATFSRLRLMRKGSSRALGVRLLTVASYSHATGADARPVRPEAGAWRHNPSRQAASLCGSARASVALRRYRCCGKPRLAAEPDSA